MRNTVPLAIVVPIFLGDGCSQVSLSTGETLARPDDAVERPRALRNDVSHRFVNQHFGAPLIVMTSHDAADIQAHLFISPSRQGEASCRCMARLNANHDNHSNDGMTPTLWGFRNLAAPTASAQPLRAPIFRGARFTLLTCASPARAAAFAV